MKRLVIFLFVTLSMGAALAADRLVRRGEVTRLETQFGEGITTVLWDGGNLLVRMEGVEGDLACFTPDGVTIVSGFTKTPGETAWMIMRPILIIPRSILATTSSPTIPGHMGGFPMIDRRLYATESFILEEVRPLPPERTSRAARLEGYRLTESGKVEVEVRGAVGEVFTIWRAPRIENGSRNPYFPWLDIGQVQIGPAGRATFVDTSLAPDQPVAFYGAHSYGVGWP